jgi:hypothetical protein
MLLSLLIALAAAPSGAAHWRMAAARPDQIIYIFSDEYVREGDAVRFRMATHLREPDARILTWSDLLVSADCQTLAWRSEDTWYDNSPDFVSHASSGRAASGSLMAEVIGAACRREYPGGPIQDTGRDAESRLLGR